MKKNLSKSLVGLMMLGVASLQVNAQAFKYPFFQHYTQASCGPCAAQNPGFQTAILNANPTTVHHMAVHTSWPGVDPMYSANPTIADDLVTYYNITGVPSVVLQGNFKQGGPSAFQQADVDAVIAQTSPIRVDVSHVVNGMTRTVTVVVTNASTNTFSNNYTLRTAVIERNVNYTSAPGNNGETFFPNVLRELLPNSAGDVISIPAPGATLTMTYTYTLDVSWVDTEIEELAWVQDDATKEVLNSGASFDVGVNASINPPAVITQNVVANTTTTFALSTGNLSPNVNDFDYALTSTAPGNWTASYNVNGTNYTANTTISIPGNTNFPTDIVVVPGATAGIGEYTLTITATGNPLVPAMIVKVYVISGVGTLLINNSGGLGDGTTAGDASNWQQVYMDGLAFANCTDYAIANEKFCARAIKDNAMTGINKIFYNVGWTFPGLTDDLVAQLSTFLDNGGRLFIAGQDIGWEAFDGGAQYSTQAKMDFYNNYLHANYVGDGSTNANVAFNLNTNDVIFGGTTSTTLKNFYGGTYFFPDDITAMGIGAVTAYYGAGTTKPGGVRSWNNINKTVYFPPGMEMVTSVAVKDQIVKLSYDWFNDLISVEEYDAAMAKLGQAYPNPANGNVFIPITNAFANSSIQVTDITGRVVLTQSTNGQTTVELNVAALNAGYYTYRIVSGNTATNALPLEIVK